MAAFVWVLARMSTIECTSVGVYWRDRVVRPSRKCELVSAGLRMVECKLRCQISMRRKGPVSNLPMGTRIVLRRRFRGPSRKNVERVPFPAASFVRATVAVKATVRR